jgi:raffinose/stachyose/melibiose transport system permease protein
VAEPSRRTGAPPGEPRLVGYLYVLPALLVFAAFLLWPILRAVSLSFYEWDGLTQGTWVGLDNYLAVVSDPTLRAPFVHALVLVLFFCVAPIGIGLALAGLMSRVHLRGMAFFRTVIFLPQVVATVVVGIAWSAIYAPQGPLNDMLSAVGLAGGRSRRHLGLHRAVRGALPRRSGEGSRDAVRGRPTGRRRSGA